MTVETVAAALIVPVLALAGVPLALWRLGTRLARGVDAHLGALAERRLRGMGPVGRRGVGYGVGALLARVRVPLAVAVAVLALVALLLAAASGARRETALAIILGLIGAALVARLVTAAARRPLRGLPARRRIRP